MAAERNVSGPPTTVDRFRLDVVATAVVCLPIVFGALRAAAGNWLPIGDDAYFSLRSLDVGTGHHPLLGAWSSGSIDTGRSVNNLGPLELDVLSVFTRWTPYGGTAIAVAAVNVAALITSAWMLGRLGGRTVVVAAMVPIALLCWTLGSEMLITPRQHQFLLLTYLCFLITAWGAGAGDRWATVPLVVAGSMLVQTHLSYPILVGGVGAVAVAGQAVAFRRGDGRATYQRPWTIAVLLAALMWMQTLYDQLFGWGNLGDVLGSSSSTDRPGWFRAVELVGEGLLDPGHAIRRGYATYDPSDSAHRTLAVLGLGVILAMLAGVLVWAWRSARVVAAAGAAVAIASVAAATTDAVMLPVTFFGLTAGNYRWLWPTTTFLAIGAAAALVRYGIARTDTRVGAVFLVPVVLLAVANVPRSVQVPDPDRYLSEQAMVAEMTSQLSGLSVDGPVVVDQSHMYFGHPFAYPVALALRSRGTEYRFEEPDQRRRFGADRVADGGESETLILWSGQDAAARFDDPTAVVRIDGPNPFVITLERE